MASIKNMKRELKDKTNKYPEKYYPIDVLKEEGYVRRKCTKCEKYFWTLTDDSICGEPECSEGYKFIDKPIGKKIDFISYWKNFSTFFSKRDYTPIKRYPIAARWRDDTDFVQASIYDFQPYVVMGEIDPPANPLVVPQYCVRFNSIDSVGITGRHNTGFVMIGQHAFFPENKFNKPKYFKDLFEWFVKEMKIPKAELKIIENQWGGGGNLGVCMEFFAMGLELANQVYMLYKITHEGYENLKLNVLDMGMGQDRTPWLTNGTTTIYEVDYPPVCEKLYKKTGIYPNDVYKDFMPYGSLLDVDSDIQLNKMWLKIANKMGTNVKELEENVLPLAALYSVADHTQSLLVSISDGVLPSNVGGGYNLRVILRRALRFIKKYEWSIDLIDICEWHAEYLLPQYPELIENLDELQEIFEHEESKYKKTQHTAEKEILRMIGRNIIPSDKELYSLYESKGIVPETVKILFEKHGKPLNIPPDFYSKLTSSHLKENVIQTKEDIKMEVLYDIEDTELKYYEIVDRFSANVLKIDYENNFIVLDKTHFYPEGGGQESDTGKIGNVEIVDVQKIRSVVVHKFKGKTDLKEGDIVDCKINLDRRKQLTQNHTATHIINGAARRVLGNHVWQSGAHKSEDIARLDITHYESLTDKEMEKIEKLANKVVHENRKIEIFTLPRNEAEKKYGFRLYQGGAIPGRDIRIVDIKDWDVEACGGTHCELGGNFIGKTDDVEVIKLIRSKGIQDGVIRLEFVAGDAAKRNMRKQKELFENSLTPIAEFSGLKIQIPLDSYNLTRELKNSADALSVPLEQLAKTTERFVGECKKLGGEIRELGEEVPESKLQDADTLQEASKILFEEWKAINKKVEKLKKNLKNNVSEKLEEEFKSNNFVKYISHNIPVKDVVSLAKEITEKENRVLILVNIFGKKANVVCASSNKNVNAGDVAQRLSRKLGGGGHGNKKLGLGGGEAENAEKILEDLFKALSEHQ